MGRRGSAPRFIFPGRVVGADSAEPRSYIGKLRIAVVSTMLAASLGLAIPTGALPPHPGCGFGDVNHSHQAPPGLDPLNLRPGEAHGDVNHPHTAPPGQAPADGGDQTSPIWGCKPGADRS